MQTNAKGVPLMGGLGGGCDTKQGKAFFQSGLVDFLGYGPLPTHNGYGMNTKPGVPLEQGPGNHPSTDAKFHHILSFCRYGRPGPAF